MARKKTVDKEAVNQIIRTTLDVLPLLRKKLLRMDAVQAEHAMPMSHIQVLCMLKEDKVLSVSDISCRLGIAKPNITPLVDRLIEEGYVRRERSQLDRRVVNVVLLPEGEKKLDLIIASIVDQTMEWVNDDIQHRDFQELERSLTTIERVIGSAL